jgi:putative ABC transport system substrate-binding protein
MKRREFITALGGAAVWPLFAARAQQPGRIPVVGALWHGSAEKERANPFYHWAHDDFANLGYISEKTVKFEERYASEKQELYDQLANELVGLSPDVLMAASVPAAFALKKATSRIPIVFIGVSDPVGSGLVASMARPGGNVTGMAAPGRETYSKRVAILKEITPRLSRLALLANLDEPSHAAIETNYYKAAATANGADLEVFAARDKRSIDEVLPKMVQAGCDGVVIANQGVFFLLRDELSEATMSNRLPTMGPSGVFVSSGVLISYAPVLRERWRQTVTYAARILRGEKPNDLPVEFPTRFELTLNLKTAAALNLTIPTTVLASADQVIE